MLDPSSPSGRTKHNDKPHIDIAYDQEGLNNNETPTKQRENERYIPNYAMLHAKKAIDFDGKLSRENSSDNLVEQKYKKDMYFPVDNDIKFDDLYDWGNLLKQPLSSCVGNKSKTGTVVTCNKQKIALFRYGEELFAIDEKCPHLGGPLHLGDIENVGEASILCVICPWHKWRIELPSGRVKMPPDRGIRTVVYPTKIMNDRSMQIGFDEISREFFDGNLDF